MKKIFIILFFIYIKTFSQDTLHSRLTPKITFDNLIWNERMYDGNFYHKERSYDLNFAKFELLEMQKIACLQYKSYRKYRKCILKIK